MTYTMRNTLVMFIFLLCVSVGFFFFTSKYTKQLEAEKKKLAENKKVLNQLKQANPDIDNSENLVVSLENMRKKARENKKLILRDDQPTDTYNYLINLSQKYCNDMSFDFLHQQTVNKGDLVTNIYNVSGMGRLKALYAFVFNIEKQSPLYTVDQFFVAQNTGSVSDSVAFNLVLQSYSNNTGIPREEIAMNNLIYSDVDNSLFKPRLHEPVYNDEDGLHIDIEKATLVGLTVEKAFLKDHLGEVHMLSVGDKVNYGSLGKINWTHQYAVFFVNKIGIIEEKVLYLTQEE